MPWWTSRSRIVRATLFHVDISGHSDWAKQIARGDRKHRLSKAASRAELAVRLDVRLRFHGIELVAWLGDGGFFAARGIAQLNKLAYFADKTQDIFESWRDEKSLSLRMAATYDSEVVVDQIPAFWLGT